MISDHPEANGLRLNRNYSHMHIEDLAMRVREFAESSHDLH